MSSGLCLPEQCPPAPPADDQLWETILIPHDGANPLITREDADLIAMVDFLSDNWGPRGEVTGD